MTVTVDFLNVNCGCVKQGLQLYLVMLSLARQGQCPLLEAGMSRMMAEEDIFLHIIDVVFADQEV